VRFRTALALAAGVHALGLLLLWRTWPPPAPSGQVVPLELRSVEPPPPPPPPPVAAPVAVAAGGGGGGTGKAAKRSPRMVIALQPEPGGEQPAAAQAPGPAAPGNGMGSGPPTGSGSAPTGPPVAPARPAGVDHSALRAQAMERITQQRRYPELARRRRIEGTVIVGFRITPEGGVTGLRIKKGVDELLDQAALEAVQGATPLPGALAADGELEVPFQFSLRP